jgi:hypothetical protein
MFNRLRSPFSVLAVHGKFWIVVTAAIANNNKSSCAQGADDDYSLYETSEDSVLSDLT